MASDESWPIVQPLPKIIVQLVLAFCFVAGHVLLWNDRRINRAVLNKASSKPVDSFESAKTVKIEKPMGLPAYK